MEIYGAPGEIRTPDLTLRRRSLYPAELRAHMNSISYFRFYRTAKASASSGSV